MNQIKAWDKKTKSMWMVDGFEGLTKNTIVNLRTFPVEDAGGLHFTYINRYEDEVVLLEYIGRRDVLGKDICDRDILINESGRICKVVRFNSECFVGWDLKALNGKGSPPAEGHMWEGWEIIGDEFENPGLEKEIK